METKILLEQVKAKLKEGGYGGLYYPGECGCTIDDLAPCGECEYDEVSGLINGCEAGYVFKDPRPGAPMDWMIRGRNEEPTIEDWEYLDGTA